VAPEVVVVVLAVLLRVRRVERCAPRPPRTDRNATITPNRVSPLFALFDSRPPDSDTKPPQSRPTDRPADRKSASPLSGRRGSRCAAPRREANRSPRADRIGRRDHRPLRGVVFRTAARAPLSIEGRKHVIASDPIAAAAATPSARRHCRAARASRRRRRLATATLRRPNATNTRRTRQTQTTLSQPPCRGGRARATRHTTRALAFPPTSRRSSRRWRPTPRLILRAGGGPRGGSDGDRELAPRAAAVLGEKHIHAPLDVLAITQMRDWSRPIETLVVGARHW